MIRPLAGLKVIDFSRYFPGPYASLRLLDWGAEVIKIEGMEGDPSRPYFATSGGSGPVFRALNRGKHSIFANLKDSEHFAYVKNLVDSADVLLEGFRPGTMARLGLGYEDVRKDNPGIVYCSLSGFGSTGSYTGKSGHDLNYMALCGALSLFTDGEGKLHKPPFALGDFTSGVMASEAILAGLLQRARSGEGCFVDVSITEAAQALLVILNTQASMMGESFIPGEDLISYYVYETSDGRWVSLGAVEEKFYQAFCVGADRADLIAGHSTPVSEDNPYYVSLRELFKSKTFAQWCDFAAVNDCCFEPVLTIAEAAQLNLFAERGTFAYRDGTSYLLSHYLGGADTLPSGEIFPVTTL
jgi:crotonobetainyl-CoA:carnitine CoA-transferase CaiB-like acyl-CoA transferase